MDTCYLCNDNFEKEAKGLNRTKISSVTSSRSMAVNSMKNDTKHITIKFHISPSKCFLCQVIILELVYGIKKISTVYYIYEKNDLIQIYGILKTAPFCLQSNALMCLILIQRQ